MAAGVKGTTRPLRIRSGFMPYAEGSCLVEWGRTRVICTASVEHGVPPFLRDTGQGWVTGEYAMLPRATQQRTPRESLRGRPGGRTMEIQRLIGRCLRTVTQLEALGERTIIVDCDVIQGDGGTRCAAISGGWVALAEALRTLKRQQVLPRVPLTDFVAAVSVGVVKHRPVLDMSYAQDSQAEVDMNVVMTGQGRFVEIQGTAERTPFPQAQLLRLLALAKQGIAAVIAAQHQALGISRISEL